MSQEFQKDEALFEQLKQQKKRRRRKVFTTVAVIVLVVAIALVITVSVLRRKVQTTYGGSPTKVLSHTVATGTLSTVVSGKGVLAEDELESITVPEGVQISEVLVEAHETVAQGQVLATVDMSSVMTAMSALQETLKELDAQIGDARDDKVDASLTTHVAGRVKLLYGEVGMSVADCMQKHGALAVLSLDGFMAVDIETDALREGDQVSVLREDGKQIKGTVDAVIGSTATVLVTDDGPRCDETVQVMLEDAVLGEGKLYIHEPLAITGYAGTIQTVHVAENRRVYKSSALFRLTDTATTHLYDSLLRQRSEQEETLLELLNLQRTGAVVAPWSGSVFSVDYDELLLPTAVVTMSADEQMSVTLSVDESDILSLELGQTAEITVSSLSDDPFMGTVTEIDKTSTASGVYSAVITLDKTEDMLAGMTASVRILITGVENALLIPIDALHQTRSGAYVYTTYDAEADTFGGEVAVTVGIMGTDEVEILTGLAEGDVVWYKEELNIFDFFMGGGSSGSRD